MSEAKSPANVLIIGTGEYTTGYVGGQAADSDKGAGIVALAFFDLRSRGLIGSRMGMCGYNGTKFPGIRKHLKEQIGDVYGLNVNVETWPADDTKDATAYQKAIDSFSPGDLAVVVTPDDTHFDISLYAIRRGLHVLVCKPLVKTLAQHRELVAAADAKGVLLAVEYHKRWDPIYNDAVFRIKKLGDFGFFNAYMSQPRSQLQTFKNWAGRSSDISYYLNSHHIDLHAWAMGAGGPNPIAKVYKVQGVASNGICMDEIGVDAEDTITLTAHWRNSETKSTGIALYTASWGAARNADVHSQQRFHYMGHKGELMADQAHRGYQSIDHKGYASVNPLFWRYTPDHDGKFAGQNTYGYKSFEVFCTAVQSLNQGDTTLSQWDCKLATGRATLVNTAILEAGRLSLDHAGSSVQVTYDQQGAPATLVVEHPTASVTATLQTAQQETKSAL